MKSFYFIIILLFFITSCSQKKIDNEQYAMADIEEEIIPLTRQEELKPPVPPAPPVTIENQSEIKKKIIKDGRLGLQVIELDKTKSRVDTLIKIYGGYYDNESFNNSDSESSYSLKIRIPCLYFEKFISEIEKGNGEIQYKEIIARDVTDQFIDLETRLQNKKNYLKRYNEILSKAQTVKDILEIEEKMRVIEEEIESTVGRLKYLSDQVDFSSLDLTISKRNEFKFNPDNRDKFPEKLKQSLSKGWYGFVDFFLFIIKLWPFWIIITIIFYLWKKFKKKKKK